MKWPEEANRARKYISDCFGLGGWKDREIIAEGMEFIFEVMF